MSTYNYDYIEKNDTTEDTLAVTRGEIVLGIDFTNGDALRSNNGFKQVAPPENLLQRIIKFLRTEKDIYKIYEEKFRLDGNGFGWSIFETIGHTYTSVVLPKYSLQIRNFLANQYDVISVNSILLKPVEDKILVTINLTSIYGEVDIKDVINDNFKLYGKG